MATLKDNLVFIKWYHTPPIGSDSQKLYLAQMQQALDEAYQAVFFLSDLRQGCIDDLETLRALGELTKHPHWGGGAAFSQNRATATMANVFRRMAQRSDHEDSIFTTLEKALEYLEQLKPGITAGLEWERILADFDAQASE